ncbi:MAG: DUF4445 domain-containing protein [Treponema sp.]|nr:DUF4445 domain-containing protein [Treponema sp.]
MSAGVPPIQTPLPIPEPPEDCPLSHVGLAVDVGTTTVVVGAWSLRARALLATVAEQNRQARFGSDVVSRIAHAAQSPHGAADLHGAIVAQLETLFARALRMAQAQLPRGISPVVSRIVVTGNTAMLSLACGVPVAPLAAAPFRPASLFGMTAAWGDVRAGTAGGRAMPGESGRTALGASVVADGTDVYLPPCVSAFVGADTVCAMLAAGFPVPAEMSSAAPLLLADIGTNSELALYVPETPRYRSRILCTSCAAGPAFEAANISCGMSAVAGAIDLVQDTDGALACRVIGGGRARGICGSGLVSAVAALRALGWMDGSGMLCGQQDEETRAVMLADDVRLTQADVRNVQLAKSAVRTGLDYLLGMSPSLPTLCLAGAFGTELPLESAAAIGLLPPPLTERTVRLGNAALSGATALLFSPGLRQKCAALAAASRSLNLAAIPDFQTRFLHALDF